MSTTKSIEGLLEKPVYMMTGEEYLELTHYALANSPAAANRSAQAGQKAQPKKSQTLKRNKVQPIKH